MAKTNGRQWRDLQELVRWPDSIWSTEKTPLPENLPWLHQWCTECLQFQKKIRYQTQDKPYKLAVSKSSRWVKKVKDPKERVHIWQKQLQNILRSKKGRFLSDKGEILNSNTENKGKLNKHLFSVWPWCVLIT